MFYEANERPRHATTTVVIRSKPIAPETDGFTSLLDTSYIGRIDKTTVHDDLAMPHPWLNSPFPVLAEHRCFRSSCVLRTLMSRLWSYDGGSDAVNRRRG